jgi:hypothetical protein
VQAPKFLGFFWLANHLLPEVLRRGMMPSPLAATAKCMLRLFAGLTVPKPFLGLRV